MNDKGVRPRRKGKERPLTKKTSATQGTIETTEAGHKGGKKPLKRQADWPM